MPDKLNIREQFTGFAILDYLIDQFRTGKQEYTRGEVLSLLRCVKAEGDIFTPAVRELYDQTVEAFDRRATQ